MPNEPWNISNDTLLLVYDMCLYEQTLTCIYIYIYRERERDKELKRDATWDVMVANSESKRFWN